MRTETLLPSGMDNLARLNDSHSPSAQETVKTYQWVTYVHFEIIEFQNATSFSATKRSITQPMDSTFKITTCILRACPGACMYGKKMRNFFYFEKGT